MERLLTMLYTSQITMMIMQHSVDVFDLYCNTKIPTFGERKKDYLKNNLGYINLDNVKVCKYLVYNTSNKSTNTRKMIFSQAEEEEEEEEEESHIYYTKTKTMDYLCRSLGMWKQI